MNIILLSRLWYRTKVCDFLKQMLNTLETTIRNLIWAYKKGGQVRQVVLQLEYEKGGQQLVDIK